MVPGANNPGAAAHALAQISPSMRAKRVKGVEVITVTDHEDFLITHFKGMHAAVGHVAGFEIQGHGLSSLT
ncbi:hypothetical protein DESA109040_10000 [Deinococcus saxicola]